MRRYRNFCTRHHGVFRGHIFAPYFIANHFANVRSNVCPNGHILGRDSGPVSDSNDFRTTNAAAYFDGQSNGRHDADLHACANCDTTANRDYSATPNADSNSDCHPKPTAGLISNCNAHHHSKADAHSYTATRHI